MNIKMIDNGYLVEFRKDGVNRTVFCKTVNDVLTLIKDYYAPPSDWGH